MLAYLSTIRLDHIREDICRNRQDLSAQHKLRPIRGYLGRLGWAGAERGAVEHKVGSADSQQKYTLELLPVAWQQVVLQG